MWSSDDEGLSQLYLELVGAYKKKFVSKWTSHHITALLEAWKREAMAHNTLLKGCLLKIKILTRLLFIFI